MPALARTVLGATATTATMTVVAALAAPGTAQAALPTAARPASVRPAAAPTPGWRTYTVRPGDTMIAIARSVGTTTGTIARANGLTDGGRLILVGQRLRVPASPTTATPAPSPRTTPAAPRPGSGARSGRAVRDLIAATARRYGVDPQLAIAVGYQESGWQQSARSSAGAIGTMQVMPANRRWLSSLAGRDLDLTVTEDNVVAGVLLLRHLVAAAPSLDHAIGGYYQGLPSIMRRGAYRDTVRYVASVKALMRRL